MPSENPGPYDLVSNVNRMDFSRNSQGYGTNNPGGLDSGDLNASNVTDHEFLRRLAASRGFSMHDASNMNMNVSGVNPQLLGGSSGGNAGGNFGLGAMSARGAGGSGSGSSAAMFGQGVSTNQHPFTGAASALRNVQGDPQAMMQADREEELLLQLLIARRRRHDQQDPTANAPSGNDGAALADELLRLRQAQSAAGASSAAALAMFGGGGDQQQMGQSNQGSMLNPNASGFGATNMPGGFSQNATGLNLPQNAPFGGLMGQGGQGASGMGRRFDDYLLRTQQQQHKQEAIMGSGNPDHQRIEPSTSRLLGNFPSMGQGGPNFLDLGVGGANHFAGTSNMLHNKRGYEEFKGSSPSGDLEKATLEPSSSKKKRYHKKKPADMPRRPLSAYNLFFSEERERILKEINSKDKDETSPDKEAGSEDKDEKDTEGAEEEKLPMNEESESGKPRALLRPLLPSEKKRRPHRKTHGKISFQLLAQMVGKRWKALPADRRKYYQDLAKEDMKRQKLAMEEYYKKQGTGEKGETPTTSTVKTSATDATVEGKKLEQETTAVLAE